MNTLSNFWFTADTHFGHANIIKYCNRPFSSVEEMDETLIERWNRCVQPNDIVYHLGDFCFHSSPKKYTSRLNGNINLILGNHDIKKQCQGHFCSIHESLMFKHNDIEIFLSHFAHRVWDKSHFNVPHLYGHSHGKIQCYGKSFDIGVDCHDFEPKNLEEVDSLFRLLPDNPNYIGKDNIRF